MRLCMVKILIYNHWHNRDRGRSAVHRRKTTVPAREGGLCNLSFVTLTVDCSVLAPFPDRIPRSLRAQVIL